MKYNEKSVGPFVVGTSPEVPFSAKGATFGPAIDAPLYGFVILVGVIIANAPSKGKTKLLLQCSLDGETFSAAKEVGEVDLKEEGEQAIAVDLTKIRAPFYRLGIAGKDGETEVIEPYVAPEESDEDEEDDGKGKKKKKEKKAEPGTVVFRYGAPTNDARL